MQYDPIKRSLGNIFNRSTALRKLFYGLLDLLLLRAWHVHKELKRFQISDLRITNEEALLNRKSEIANRKLNILDAGSGYGQYSYWMQKHFRNCSILAVDVKDEQVADCNRFFQSIGATNVKFEIADLTKFSKPDTFDLVLSVDVMEHILEDEMVFKNFYSSMKQGAMLLISTPSDQGGSDVHDGEESSFIEEHVRDGYNISDIQDKLRRAGFSKVEARFAYGTPGKIAWRLSMKYPILMLGASKLFFIILPFYYIIAYPISFVLNYFDTHMNHPTGTGLIVKAWK